MRTACSKNSRIGLAAVALVAALGACGGRTSLDLRLGQNHLVPTDAGPGSDGRLRPEVGPDSPRDAYVPDVRNDAPDLGIDRPDLAVERPDLGIDRPDLAVERPDLGIDRPDLAVERPDLGGDQAPDLGSDAGLEWCPSFNRLAAPRFAC